MSSQHIKMFFGDGRDSENPQDFIKMLKVSFDQDSTLTPEQKCQHFRRHCRSTMDAEEWFDTLNTVTSADWAKLKTTFDIQWPPHTRIKPTPAERTKELRNTLLTEEEILEKKEKGGIMIYGYTAWITEVTHMAALCDTGNAHVQSVYETMPRVMRDLVSEGDLTTWATFATAVRAIPFSKLRNTIADEARHKAIEERLAELDRRACAPPCQSSSAAIEELRRAFGGFTISNAAAPRAYAAAPQTHAAAPVIGGAQKGPRLFATYARPPAPAAAQPAPYTPAPARTTVTY